MHEVSLVADLIDACLAQAAGRPVQRVRVRHATTIPSDALEQAFRMLTVGGPLADATLDAERFDVVLRCACGFDGSVGHDDVVGSVAICPACGLVSTLHRTAELELVEVVTSGGLTGSSFGASRPTLPGERNVPSAPRPGDRTVTGPRTLDRDRRAT